MNDHAANVFLVVFATIRGSLRQMGGLTEFREDPLGEQGESGDLPNISYELSETLQ